MKFARLDILDNKDTPLNTRWYLKITTVYELYEWYEKMVIKNFGQVVHDLFTSKDSMLGTKDGTHRTHPYSFPFELMLMNISEPKDIFSDINETAYKMFLKPKIEALQRYGTIYIKYEGGFWPKVKDVVEFEVRDADECPITHVTIYKWKSGTHYYIGDKKWDSLIQAKREAERSYGKNIEIRIKVVDEN